MKELRIVKRTNVDGTIKYVIQKRHWWKWIDACLNTMAGPFCKDRFSTLEEAEKNLCYFDGSKPIDEVIK